CARYVPSTGRPSTTLGPVQPLGVLRTIIGQRGRSVTPRSRASDWIRRISAMTLSSVSAIKGCIASGSCPSTNIGGDWIMLFDRVESGRNLTKQGLESAGIEE